MRLLSQLTNQVALAQYPSFGTARVRHVELVGLTPHRVMTVLITDTGRVDQRTAESAAGGDPETLGRLRERFNAELGGKALSDAAIALHALVRRGRARGSRRSRRRSSPASPIRWRPPGTTGS